MMHNGKLKIVVLGMMGRCPFAGQTWLYLNWLSGLRQLGHDVWYVEDDTVWPYDPRADTITDNCDYATQHIAACTARIGLNNRWAFRLADRKNASWGLSEPALNQLYKDADVLLNVVGATDLREEQLASSFRVYVETDPVTAELQLAMNDTHTKEAFANHHLVATYGENYGAPDCGVPLNGIKYLKTRQPIDLQFWENCYTPTAKFFTTIGNYRQEGNDVQYNGETYYWSKHHEWEKILDLPKRTNQQYELALNVGNSRDMQHLQDHSWKVVPALQMSLDIFGAYPNYIRGSRAELTVAKDQNVRLRSGWFSERDACYLASGKPVVAQETGFSNVLPTGSGLFAFSTADEAAHAVEAINADYERHAKAARKIAEEYFDASKVAAKLLKDIGLR